MQRLLSIIIGALLGAFAASASAEELAVGNYGVSANGMPFGVAMAKGYFKEEGLNVTGLISSAGGGTSLRNMLAGGGVPYGEVNPGVVVSAILAGADLKIISDNVLTVAEFVWAVKPESPIKSIKDFKGKKIGYTNPRSTSQALARMLLQQAGLHRGRRRARQDRRLRRGDRRAGFGPDRRGGDHRAAVVEGQAQVPRRRRRERSAAAARQRRRRDDRRDGREEGRLPARGHPCPAQGGQIHDREPRRSRRDRRQGIQARPRCREERRAQSRRPARRRACRTGARARSTWTA